MNKQILTGLAAAGAAILIPWFLTGAGEQKELVETVAEITELPTEISSGDVRTVNAIVVHENAAVLKDEEISVTVELHGVPKEMTLNQYLVGVLMGEMPASFEEEALKAQAVAARTYTLRRLEQGGLLSDDPGVCQAFEYEDAAEEKWGENAELYLEKLHRAVEDTDGQVLTYNGELISATYFSCSGGKTESAQAVWGGQVPYLVSVESPGEEEAAAFESIKTVSMEEFINVLGVPRGAVSAVTYTDGGGVETITIDGKTFSGTEMRSLLGLRSTLFRMEMGAEEVTFYVQGFGHRVGMSQYGAQAMAEAGETYDSILKWYYTGVEISDYA